DHVGAGVVERPHQVGQVVGAVEVVVVDLGDEVPGRRLDAEVHARTEGQVRGGRDHDDVDPVEHRGFDGEAVGDQDQLDRAVRLRADGGQHVVQLLGALGRDDHADHRG